MNDKEKVASLTLGIVVGGFYGYLDYTLERLYKSTS